MTITSDAEISDLQIGERVISVAPDQEMVLIFDSQGGRFTFGKPGTLQISGVARSVRIDRREQLHSRLDDLPWYVNSATTALLVWAVTVFASLRPGVTRRKDPELSKTR